MNQGFEVICLVLALGLVIFFFNHPFQILQQAEVFRIIREQNVVNDDLPHSRIFGVFEVGEDVATGLAEEEEEGGGVMVFEDRGIVVQGCELGFVFDFEHVVVASIIELGREWLRVVYVVGGGGEEDAQNVSGGRLQGLRGSSEGQDVVQGLDKIDENG